MKNKNARDARQKTRAPSVRINDRLVIYTTIMIINSFFFIDLKNQFDSWKGPKKVFFEEKVLNRGGWVIKVLNCFNFVYKTLMFRQKI